MSPGEMPAPSGDATGNATDPRRSVRAAGTRARVLAVALLAVVLLVAGTGLTLASLRADADRAFAAAARSFSAREAAAIRATDAARAAMADARATVTASTGRLLSDEPRTRLARAIDGVEPALRSAERELTSAHALAVRPVDDGPLSAGTRVRDRAERLAGTRFAEAARLDRAVRTLAEPVSDVDAAVASWQEEQDRILRQRYHNRVQAAGWLPELDQCQGSVDVTAHYGVPTIAEHWSCGGKDFPDDPGTVIVLTGERAGVYRVEGIVAMLNQRTATSADIPRGYDLIYQTCQNGQSATMSMTALTRIG